MGVLSHKWSVRPQEWMGLPRVSAEGGEEPAQALGGHRHLRNGYGPSKTRPQRTVRVKVRMWKAVQRSGRTRTENGPSAGLATGGLIRDPDEGNFRRVAGWSRRA